MENIFSHHKRSLIYITLVTIVLFLVLFAVLAFFIDGTSKSIARRDAMQVKEVLENEKERALTEAESIGNLENVREYIKDKDSQKLIPILAEEAEKRDLSVLMAVDEDGIVLVRSHALSRSGDNVFETTHWGREAAKGNETVLFGEGRTEPLVLIATHPIIEEENVVGAIFAGQNLKGDYAEEFKRKYLDEKTHIAIYSAEQGIIGSSFTDSGDKKLIASNFSTGSNWIRQEETEADILMDGEPYFLQNAVLEGANSGENPGGILIFHKTNHALRSLILALLLTGLFVFLFDYFEVHKKVGHKEFLRKHFIGATIIFIAVFIISFMSSQYLLYQKATKINTTSFTIYNSTLHLSPGFDIYKVGSTQQIGVEVETGGEAINVISFVLNYDPTKITVDDLVTNNSICPESLFIENSIDNEAGQVKVSCGIPNGFSDVRGTVAELAITPTAEGDFRLIFGEETTVLANDGLGTDVLRFAENGSYQASLGQSSRDSDIPPRMTVFSETHPNRELEYNSSSIDFSWLNAGDRYDYIYAFDKDPNTIPSGERSTTNNSLNFSVSEDGTYYLHVAARRGDTRGPVSHYRAMVDTTPPNPPIVKASSTSVSVGNVVRFEFSTDDTDELQPNFYLRIGNDVFVPTTQQVYVPFFERGTHKVTVRVFDTAGNYTDTSMNINVKGKSLWERLLFFVDFRSVLSSQLIR